jgi:hypothetical protein
MACYLAGTLPEVMYGVSLGWNSTRRSVWRVTWLELSEDLYGVSLGWNSTRRSVWRVTWLELYPKICMVNIVVVKAIDFNRFQ